ncbi:MAG: matrixin family metalloprotease [Acidobacteriaceae bacterium]|nr:matrixin family metalloprotease [Acidobacteriaceae bacterium]
MGSRIRASIMALGLIAGSWATGATQTTRIPPPDGKETRVHSAAAGTPKAWTPDAEASPASEVKGVNFYTPDEPCAQYNDLKQYDLGSIGVKIDTIDPRWAKAVRQAMEFWNSVLNVHLHEERDIKACAIKVIDGPPVVLQGGDGYSQFTDWEGFQGKLALGPQRIHNARGRFSLMVHEFGHLFGLRHNDKNGKSVMCAIVDEKTVLDIDDLRALEKNHQLRSDAAAILDRSGGKIRVGGIRATFNRLLSVIL